MEKTLLKVNRERLLETIKISSSIGSSAHGGLHRLALSEADKNMRDIFVDWLKAEGLAVRIDDFGNIYGRRKGKRITVHPLPSDPTWTHNLAAENMMAS